ncbi:MAG: RluA family pseudouridine synthase [Clostridiales bacterium]|nr:RluA family pseudouridine synthase [Clostridiales bacterium]
MTREDVFELEATEEDGKGERADVFLSASLEDLSRSYVQKLIEAGMMTVNGEVCRSKKYRVAAGDRIRLELPAVTEAEAAPEDIPIEIVYEDNELLLIDKPKGMVVHPAPGNETGTLVNAVLFHCKGRLSSINGKARPGIVHRIDKDTSGLIVVAKSDFAHRSLASQLESHTMTRAYDAIVYNNFASDDGIVDAPIGRDPRNRLRQAVTDVNSRSAVTRYRVVERFGRFTHVEARLETGRTHQIRVHMAYIQHPVLGDMLYGPKKQAMGADSQVLHASLLGFFHPSDGKYLEFESGLPKEFVRIVGRLRSGSRL